MSSQLNLYHGTTAPPSGRVDFLYQAADVLEQRAHPKIRCRVGGHHWKWIHLDVDAQDAGIATVDGEPLPIGRLNEEIQCCERCGYPNWASVLMVGQKLSTHGVQDTAAIERIRLKSVGS